MGGRFWRRPPAISVAVSLVCVVGIGAIWVTALHAPPTARPGEIVLSSAADVAEYERVVLGAADDEAPDAVLIPTGVFVQSLQFTGPYTIVASGFIWQRYHDDLPDDLTPGFVMPESQANRMREIHRTRQGDEVLIAWSFEAVIRQQFDYSRYPFDAQEVWFELWHPEFAREVYLTPDSESYPSLDPLRRPGLDGDVVLEGWHIERSFFAYRPTAYSAGFGVAGYSEDAEQTELSFAVEVRRSAWNALPGVLLPPLVILGQLFVIVMVIGADRRRLEDFGVRPGAVIFTCAALLLTIHVAHNQVRGDVRSGGLVYFEAFHLVTYVATLAVAANSVLLTARPDLLLFSQHDNRYVRLIFWPLVLSPLLIVTALTLL